MKKTVNEYATLDGMAVRVVIATSKKEAAKKLGVKLSDVYPHRFIDTGAPKKRNPQTK